MVDVNRARLAAGSDEITRADYAIWVSLVLLGLQTDMDEWRPLNDYVRSSGAWDRLEWVFPRYLEILGIGPLASQPRPGRVRAVGARKPNGVAGRCRPLPSSPARLSEQRGRHATHRRRRIGRSPGRCSSGIRRSIRLTAARLMQATAHVVPDVAKELHVAF